jgi:hypothetical protein
MWESKCGCGREAEYEVYEHKEPHCESCFKEALECSVQILARKIDYFEDLRRIRYERDKVQGQANK